MQNNIFRGVYTQGNDNVAQLHYAYTEILLEEYSGVALFI